MKAISLWQPWASAMAQDVKRNETRSWPTRYRGDLVICSAKRKPSREDCDATTFDYAMTFPYGCALCVVELYDMVPSAYFHGTTPLKISQREAELGNYASGRWVWITRNCRKLKTPVPVVGMQGLWNLPPETVSLIKAQL